MATKGKIIDLGNSGVKITITKSAKETGGEISEMESIIQPGKKLPSLPHFHPLQQERIEVLSGEITTLLDGKTSKLRKGEQIIFPKGTVHNFWNEGNEILHIRVEHKPELEFQHFLETLGGLVSSGKLKYDGSISDKIQMAVVVEHYNKMMRLTRPMKFAIKMLSIVGRITGKKGFIPEYFSE